MDWLELFKVGILAVFQGVAEFLPISSSGHLQVLQFLLGFDPESNIFLSVVLHSGTLLAIVVFYFLTLWEILVKRQFKLILAIIIGTIPAGLAGVGIKLSGLDDIIFTSLLVPAIGFLFTAFLLLYALKGRTEEEENSALPLAEIPLTKALLIGIAQAVAITPGISRSGSTIAAGLKVNLKKADCARFSFLLAIPAIGGAMVLELKDLFSAPGDITSGDIMVWLFGFIIAAVVGYFSLKLLLGILQKGKLQYFAWYLLGASIFTFGLWVGSLVCR